jgi:hypothetical protein
VHSIAGVRCFCTDFSDFFLSRLDIIINLYSAGTLPFPLQVVHCPPYLFLPRPLQSLHCLTNPLIFFQTISW